MNYETVTMNSYRTGKQFFKRYGSPFEILQIGQYVKGSCVGRPGRVPGRLEHRAVNFYRQRFRFLVGHSCDSQSRVEFSEGRGESLKIGAFATHYAIRILG